MRNGFPACLAIALTLTSCSTAKPTRNDAAPAASAAVAALDLSEMIVLRARDGFQQGDTVRVDLADVTEDDRVKYYDGSGRSGSISLDALGPSGPGTMVVAADRVDVRRCPSTGCSVVGHVTRGQAVEVREFAGRWYRAALDGKSVGYVRAEYLQLPVIYRKNLFAEIQALTATYYEDVLEGQAVEGYGSAFSAYDVELDGDVLSFEFYTPFGDGPALAAVCGATRGIIDFVDSTMAETTAGSFSGYSVGVYFASPHTPAAERVMVAGPTGDGGVYCAGPD